VPLGYKLIPEKHGFLEVEEDQAKVVRQAFHAFLKEGTLTRAAKSLHRQGVSFKRQMQGGGLSARLGHFTSCNLLCMLKNKAYIGVKEYHTDGETKEVKAVWNPIVDEDTFERVQELLKNNYRRKKPESPQRYSFLLAGITVCGQCGERLSGKSAHGNGGKIPYYEHNWTTKRQSCLAGVDRVFHCDPRRILAKRIEPAVWEEVERLLKDPKAAAFLVKEDNVEKAASQP
jgi:hypothetical protein